MSFGSGKLWSRWSHGSRSHRNFPRIDALLIGPGGEVVAAYGAGTSMPAVPIIETGRLADYPNDGTDVFTPMVVTSSIQGTATQINVQPTSVVSVHKVSSIARAPVTLATLSSAALSSGLQSSSTTSASTATSSNPTSSVPQSLTATSAISSSASSSTSSLLSTSTSESSTARNSGSSAPSAAATSSALSTHAHGTSLYLGIAFAAIALVSILVALVTWYYRIRSQSRREACSTKTRWPWDRNPDDVEGGGSYDFGRLGAPSTTEKRDIFRPLPYPSAVLGADDAFRGFSPAMLNSPYRTVYVPEAQSSVPDLAPALGALQVTNYAPGDVSSDEEASRANSRQGSVPDLGEPGHTPTSSQWVEYRSEDGFSNPWPPLQTNSTIGNEDKETSEPGRTSAAPPPARPAQDGWAASLRSNIVNAFQSLGRAPTQATEDHFTTLPTRRPEREKCSDIFGDDPPADANSLTSWIRNTVRAPEEQNNDIRLPSPELLHARARIGPSPLARVPSSVYSVHSSPARSPLPPSDPTEDSHILDTLPELPLSRAASSSSQHASHKHTPRARKSRKSTVLNRKYTSSYCSVGSDMSRSSSRASAMSGGPSRVNSVSGPLTDQERFASNILRQRRKRVAEAQRLAAKQSLRKASMRLGSRRKIGGLKTAETSTVS